jgi:cytochrome P450
VTSREEPPVLAIGPDYVQDPYPLYARLREQCPVARVGMPDGYETWMVTRYEDVRAVLADPRLHKDWRELHAIHGQPTDGAFDPLGSHMLQRDPPDHTRLRRLVNKAFTPRRIETLRPRIAAITADLLDAIEGDTTDLMEALAFPLPITVICEMLGMPSRDRDEFREWTEILIGTPGAPPEQINNAAQAMFEYNSRLLAAKRAAPGDDLLSALVQARDDEDRLTESELLSMVFLLLVAGHDTTVNLIGTGTLALLTSPGQLAKLRDDPGLIPQAVEELLRFASPVNHATDRFASEDIEIGGTTIRKGDLVLAAISSANHDPDRFPGPDTLNLTRDTSGHVAFGHGIHYCVGAPLARMEAEIAFTALLERFPAIELAAPPETLRFRPGTLIRGLYSLPVRLSR